MQCRTFLVPLIAVLIGVLFTPGCRLKPRDSMPGPLPEGEVPVSATGMHSIHIALHTSDSAKPAQEAVNIRLRWRDQVLVSETIGRGVRWDPGSSRAVQFALSPVIRMDQPGSLLLEIVKPDVAPDRPPWTVEVEAMGRLTDGSVIVLLDRTEPARIGGGHATEAVWLLHGR